MFEALDREFAIWRDEDRVLPIWWRDDDAVTQTPALSKLTDLARAVQMPVHLAIIPNLVQDDLASFCEKNEELVPVAHGFAHVNHAPPSEKKCEYPASRDKGAVAAELAEGFARMSQQFGSGFVPLFVPPWNRFGEGHLSALQRVGYKGISTFTPRKNSMASDGVVQINTHVDPIDWHGSRSLADVGPMLDRMVAQLQDRRLGRADNAEPFGLLTHHLVHDSEIWAFCRALLQRMTQGPTRVWNWQELEKR